MVSVSIRVRGTVVALFNLSCYLSVACCFSLRPNPGFRKGQCEVHGGIRDSDSESSLTRYTRPVCLALLRSWTKGCKIVPFSSAWVQHTSSLLPVIEHPHQLAITYFNQLICLYLSSIILIFFFHWQIPYNGRQPSQAETMGRPLHGGNRSTVIFYLRITPFSSLTAHIVCTRSMSH